MTRELFRRMRMPDGSSRLQHYLKIARRPQVPSSLLRAERAATPSRLQRFLSIARRAD